MFAFTVSLRSRPARYFSLTFFLSCPFWPFNTRKHKQAQRHTHTETDTLPQNNAQHDISITFAAEHVSLTDPADASIMGLKFFLRAWQTTNIVFLLLYKNIPVTPRVNWVKTNLLLHYNTTPAVSTLDARIKAKWEAAQFLGRKANTRWLQIMQKCS